MSLTSVPEVKRTLEQARDAVRAQLEERFPGALDFQWTNPGHHLVETIYYYPDREGKTCFLLPVSAAQWDAIERGSSDPDAKLALCLIWAMLGENFQWQQGCFAVHRDWVVFDSNYSAEEAELLEGFTFRISDGVDIECAFSPLPIELREALLA